MSEQFDAEYDIVVVGAGASGLSAAAEAAKNGNTVAVLEKLDHVGGQGQFVEGSTAFESDEQKKRGITVTKEQGFNALMAESQWRGNADVVSAFVHNAATTIKKLTEMGAEWEHVTIYAYEQESELMTMHWAKGEGARIIELMDKAARDNGAEIFLSTAAQTLITEHGRVVGIEAKDADGQTLRLGAKGVILAGGGYASSAEMREKHSWYGANSRNFQVLGSPGNTGDGLNMAVKAGGATAKTGAILLMPVAKGKTITSHVSGAGSQPYLWVNTSGHRFTNEVVAMNFSDAANVIAQCDQAVAYTIFDQATKEHLETDGSDISLGTFIPYHATLDKIDAELEHDLATDTAAKADTIEQLAAAIDVDPNELAATVARYNEMVAAGGDDDFYKPAKYLFAVDKAPFYAVKMVAGILVSVVGIKINWKFQVIADGTADPIPGLYAVGAEASGLYGDTYPLTVPGNISGFSYTSGWLAADNAGQAIAANV
ncbi:MAG: FAD-binding protein [Cellulomonas sp.]|nr:FAD-binding protein [Cellulomonas sp.]